MKWSSPTRWQVFLLVGIFILALALRLPGLGTFMTADEDKWILRTSWFWHEVLRGGFVNTFMTTHPATPLMWIAGTGMLWQAAQLGVPIHLEPAQVPDFVMAAKVPLAIATSLLITLAVFLLAKSVQPRTALLSGLLLAGDPYLVGLSQIVHLDALFALSMLCCLLALIAYRQKPSRSLLVLAGLLQGFALATKFLPGLWGVLFGTALLLITIPVTKTSVRRGITAAATWLVVAAVALYILCPAIWTPHSIISNENYTSGLVTSYKDDAITIATDEHISLETSTEPISPLSFYVRALLTRTTPMSLLVTTGVILLVVIAGLRARSLRVIAASPSLRFVVTLLLYAVGFMVLITLVAKKGDRYALPALVTLPLIAGWGLSLAWSSLRPRIASTRLANIVAGSVLLLLGTQVLLWTPYAIAYENRLLNIRPLSQQGWGEGLDQAARWINQHPLSQRGADMYVASWYPRVFGTYFHGTTLSLSSRDDERIAFVVTYRNMGGRAQDSIATSVLEEYQGRAPVHTIAIAGKPYVWIYNTIGLHYFDRHTGELLPGQEVGQTLPQVPREWNAIDIGLATFSSRHNTGTVTLHIRESASATTDLRTVHVAAADITDSAYHRFTFEPIADSATASYYVSLTSADAAAGNAITVKFAPEDILPGEMVWRRQALSANETNATFVRTGDIAYQIP